MKLEIKEAIDKGDKIVLKMEYDQEFAETVAKAFRIKRVTEDDIEEIVMMILENMSAEDLGELGDQINE